MYPTNQNVATSSVQSLGAVKQPEPQTEIGRLVNELSQALTQLEHNGEILEKKFDAVLAPKSPAVAESALAPRPSATSQLGCALDEFVGRVQRANYLAQNIIHRASV